MIAQRHIVSAAQFAPERLRVKNNCNIAAQLVFEAAVKGSKIVVLPELCLSGCNITNDREALQCAQEQNGYQTQFFENIARKYGCWIVFGYVELKENKLHNSAAIVSPCGLVGNIRKNNLDAQDYMWASPADGLFEVIQSPWGRIGALIGRDCGNKQRESHRAFNELVRFYPPASVEFMCILDHMDPCDIGINFKPKVQWIELVESLGSNLIISTANGSCIIDPCQTIYTNGLINNSPCVVGGFAMA